MEFGHWNRHASREERLFCKCSSWIVTLLWQSCLVPGIHTMRLLSSRNVFSCCRCLNDDQLKLANFSCSSEGVHLEDLDNLSCEARQKKAALKLQPQWTHQRHVKCFIWSDLNNINRHAYVIWFSNIWRRGFLVPRGLGFDVTNPRQWSRLIIPNKHFCSKSPDSVFTRAL